MNINWYPGHMAKTRRLISENIKLIDIVVEILDARIPKSSKNPDLDELLNNRPRLVILNRRDMADEKITKKWLEYYKANHIHAIEADCKSGYGLQTLEVKIKSILKDKIEYALAKGMVKKIRVMVVGIPNSGKSSFINRITKRNCTKTEDRPGVTKEKQWTKVNKDIELLDTPGILWPKFDNKHVARNLAYTGAIKDEILDIEQLSCDFLDMMKGKYPNLLILRYKIEIDENDTGLMLLEKICKKRGYIVSGGEVDFKRGADMILDEFRSLKIGRISLEQPGIFTK